MEFREHIFSSGAKEGRHYLTCPECSDARSTATNRRKKVLAVRYEGNEAVYFCNHCSTSGRVVEEGLPEFKSTDSQLLDWSSFSKLADPDFEYLKTRGIDAAELDLLASMKFFPEIQEAPAIGYPYRADRNIKWIARANTGGKKQVQWERKGGGAGLYRRESIDYADPCLILAEGEVDCESARHLGFNAVSVPNGAPSPAQAEKVLRSIHGKMDVFSRVVIAMDDDDKGREAAEALIEAVGRRRAHTLSYPEGCKDLNDVLVHFGPDALRSVLTNTKPATTGIVRAREFFPAIDSLRKDGFSQGAKAGIDSLDNLISWHPGSLAIFTGVPGAGKSTLTDQLMCSLAENANWKFAVFSPENSGELHVAKLSAQRARASIIGGTVLCDEEDYEEAREWVDENFLFLSAEEGGTSIRSILDRADACIDQLRPDGCFGLLIDPWNYVGTGVDSASETEKVNQLLSQLQTWGIENNAMVIVVAHPSKEGGLGGGKLGGYAISGSAHWFNRATYLLSIEADKETCESLIHVHKVRHQWFGKTGTAPVTFCEDTGRFTSRLGESEELEDIDWSAVTSGDGRFDGPGSADLDEHEEDRVEDSQYPEPPEALLEDLELPMNGESDSDPLPF